MQPLHRYERSDRARQRSLSETRWARAQRFFFGDDIFVSYARHDSDYALSLADELTKKGLACFLDQWGTPPGEELPPELVERLKKATVLVIVGTRRAAASGSVMKEVQVFRKTGRPIVPITFVAEEDFARIQSDDVPEDLKGTLEGATWYKEIAGIARTVESESRLKTRGPDGAVKPSAQVVTRIVNAKGFLSRSRRLRKAFWTTAASLLALLTLAAVIIFEANRQVQQAQREQAAAEQQTRQAVEERRDAEVARDAANHARQTAEEETEKARKELLTAQGELERASADLLAANQKTQEEQAKAARARMEADRQQKNAVARQAATRADTLLAQALQNPKGWPDMFQDSALLSVEAVRRLSDLGLSSADAAQPLREALSLLPGPAPPVEHKYEIEDALLTSDGEYLIVKDGKGVLRVYEAASRTQVSEDIQLRDYSVPVFNPPRTLLATFEEKGLKIRNLPRGDVRWSVEGVDEGDFLTFSPDGKRLATTVEKEVPGNAIAWTGVVTVRDAMSGQKLSDIKYDGQLRGLAFSPVDDQVALSLEGSNLDKTGCANAEDNVVQIRDIMNPNLPARCASSDGRMIKLVFSPDGRLLAAGHDRSASIWSVSSGSEFTPIKDSAYEGEDSDEIGWLAFSPDGKTVGTMSDGVAQTWDTLTGRKLWETPLADRPEWSDLKPYLVLREGLGVRVVDVRTGRDVARFVQEEGVTGCDFAPGAGRLVVFRENRVRLYDTSSPLEIARVSSADEETRSVYSADRRYVALTDGARVLVLDAVSGGEVARLQHGGQVYALAFSPNGAYLATASGDDSVRVWETGTGREVRWFKSVPASFRGEEATYNNVEELGFSQRGKFFFFGTLTDDRDVLVYEVSSGREVARSHGVLAPSGAPIVAFTADEKHAALYEDGGARVVDTATGKQVAAARYNRHIRNPIIFSPDNKLMAQLDGGAVQVYEIKGGSKLYPVELAGKISAFDFSPRGTYLVVRGGSESKLGKVVEAETGHPVAPLKFETAVTAFNFSPDEKHLVTLGSVGKADRRDVRVWELAGGRAAGGYLHEDSVVQVAFSPDGRLMSTAGEDHLTRVFNLNTRRDVAELSHGPVKDMTFSHDSKLLVTASDDGRARVWEVSSWRELARVTHERAVTMVAFIRGREQLVTVSDDHTSRIWLLSERDLIARACGRLTRNLSRKAWSYNFGGEQWDKTCSELP